jgi:UDP-glucose 4-epimerase
MDADRRAAPRDVIVVTGAGGFLGSHVVAALRRSAPRARVVAVVRRSRARLPLPAGVTIVRGDLRTAAVWRRLPDAVTHVVHLAAAIPRVRGRATDAQLMRDNFAPIARLVERSAGWRALRHVVYGSSVSVYEPTRARLREDRSRLAPADAYGAAKLAGERLLASLRVRGVAVASLRFSSIYGLGQYQGTVLPIFANRARRGLPLQVFNPRRVQDFVHVDDAARAVTLACRRRVDGTFNVGAGRPVTMAALAEAVARRFGAPLDSIVVASGRGGPVDPGITLDIGRARRELGYRPRVSLETGLARLAREGGASAS